MRYIKSPSQMVLETIYETHHQEDDETQQCPQKQILLQFQTILNEHIYYHYYDEEIYEHFIEKIQHEYLTPTNSQTCNHTKTCPVCNHPSNSIRYKYKREPKRDFMQMQITIENTVLEIEVLEITQPNSYIELYIQVNASETETQNENLHKMIQTNLEQLKKELIILTMK